MAGTVSSPRVRKPQFGFSQLLASSLLSLSIWPTGLPSAWVTCHHSAGWRNSTHTTRSSQLQHARSKPCWPLTLLAALHLLKNKALVHSPTPAACSNLISLLSGGSETATSPQQPPGFAHTVLLSCEPFTCNSSLLS